VSLELERARATQAATMWHQRADELAQAVLAAAARLKIDTADPAPLALLHALERKAAKCDHDLAAEGARLREELDKAQAFLAATRAELAATEAALTRCTSKAQKAAARDRELKGVIQRQKQIYLAAALEQQSNMTVRLHIY
jgi:hypothetical protein